MHGLMGMMRKSLWILLVAAMNAVGAEPDWTRYGAALDRHVRAGEVDGISANLVDYEGMASDPDFAAAVQAVRDFDVRRLESDAERLAFYINAYNVLTIQLIVDHWPVETIRDIGNFFRGPWDIVMLENAEGRLTLDNIEHDIIRSIPEPRIHFAVNCASISCPDLRLEPYRAAEIDAQLDEQTRTFIDQPGKGLRVDGGNARASKIFGWYREDFEAAGGVEAFIEQYSGRPLDGVTPSLPYNWDLNVVGGAR